MAREITDGLKISFPVFAAIDECRNVVAVPMAGSKLSRADRTPAALPTKYPQADPRWYGRIVGLSNPFISASHFASKCSNAIATHFGLAGSGQPNTSTT